MGREDGREGNAIFHSQQFSSSHSWQSMAADFLDLDEDNNGRDMSHLLLVIFLLLQFRYTLYSFTHKGRGCKDDLKLLKYDNPKV